MMLLSARRLYALLAALSAPGVLAAPAERPDDYAYAAPILTSAQAPYQRIELPEAVYRGLTHADLADLRVFNADGEVVPHAVEPRALTHSTPGAPLEVPLFALGTAADAGRALNLRIETNEAGAVVSLGPELGRARGPAGAWLVDASQFGQRFQALELELGEPSRQFSGRMRVEASNDLAQWRTLVASAPLVQLQTDEHALQRLRIDWPATQARYLRLTWSGAPPAGVRERVFARVRLEPAPAARDVPRDWLALDRPALREAGGRQEYLFTVPRALPADRLRIGLPQPNSVVEVELFGRAHADAPWRSLGRHSIYRLAEGGGEKRNPDLAVSPGAELMLRTDARGGGVGAGQPEVEVGWVAHHLVFAARGTAPFTLAWGRFRATGGAYPIHTLVPGYGRQDAQALPIAEATLGAPAEAGGAGRLAEPLDARRWMLWAVLVLAVGLLGLMAWKLSRMVDAGPPPPAD
ncbi:DUF3999 domain-containing protein [Pseudothauera nasutitermitis]|uniref:DUF3999 domain-containing protein n=1 Tax=Pseudothauera nasutitermitis TaxID=2565930 RepID=A0A4V6RX95_9RHOO|nr:DUF3999 domain-containing protein [Pseudothauera nasutitermitis]THF66568.1 DUF3999 domain-containing protein [Pseudothauera nasutitermitis]